MDELLNKIKPYLPEVTQDLLTPPYLYATLSWPFGFLVLFILGKIFDYHGDIQIAIMYLIPWATAFYAKCEEEKKPLFDRPFFDVIGDILISGPFALVICSMTWLPLILLYLFLLIYII